MTANSPPVWPRPAPVESRPYSPPNDDRPARDRPLSSRSHGGRRPRGSGPRLRRGLYLLAVGVILGFFVVAYFPAGGVRGAPASVPTLSGYYIVGNGAALVAVGYVGWADVWTSAANGSQVYSNQLYLVFFNLHDYPVSVGIVARETNGWSERAVANISAVNEGAVTITLPSDPNWVTVNLTFDGVTYWAAPCATPISLLPNYILNVGGLDLFALTLISFMIIVSVGGFSLGRWAMKRAVWAPPFRLIVWGHVVLAIIAGTIFLFYQQIDALFAGWSPLVYPWLTFPMMFLTSLSYYNRAHRIEMIQGVVTESNELGVRRTEMRIGRFKGKLVAVGESWGQFWARFWGHHAVIDDGDTEKPRVLLLPVDNNVSPTASARARVKAEKEKAKRPMPTAAEALTKFPILEDTGGRDTIDFFAFVKSSEPVGEIPFAKLSIRHVVEKTVKIGTNAVTGEPVTEKRMVRRLTWPHYVDPKGPVVVDLENRHYLPAAMAWLGHATVRDLGHVISVLKQEVAALKSGFENRVNDEVYTQLRTEKYLRERATSGITDEEAAALARETATLLTPRRAATESKT